MFRITSHMAPDAAVANIDHLLITTSEHGTSDKRKMMDIAQDMTLTHCSFFFQEISGYLYRLQTHQRNAALGSIEQEFASRIQKGKGLHV